MIGDKIELVLSPRITVWVGELDGFELDKADAILSEQTTPIKQGEKDPVTGEMGDPVVPLMEMGFKQPRIYGICSIRTINGDDVQPYRSIQQYQVVASSAELRALSKWAQPLYSPDETDLKNEPAAQP
jgi:hypothetical protein